MQSAKRDVELTHYYLSDSIRLMRYKHIMVEKDRAICGLKSIGKKETEELKEAVDKIIQINNELLLRDSSQIKTMTTIEKIDERELNDVKANERFFNRFFMSYREYVNKNSKFFDNIVEAAKASEKNRKVLEVFLSMLKQGLKQAIRFKKLIIEEEHNELSMQSRILMHNDVVPEEHCKDMLKAAEELGSRFFREKEVFDTIVLYGEQLSNIKIALDIIEKEEDAIVQEIRGRIGHERKKLRLPKAA